jgi:hypothetical protein
VSGGVDGDETNPNEAIEATEKPHWPPKNGEMCRNVLSRRRRNEPIVARHDIRAVIH